MRALVSLLATVLFAHQHVSAADLFQFEVLNKDSLLLSEGAKPVLVYNYGVITNAKTPAARPHSAYIHPLYGLDGEVITGDFPADHVYHRGLYWAWPHIQIGEKEYDLWSLRGIRPAFERWLERETRDEVAILGVENAWLVNDKKVMREQVRVRVHRATANSRAIDLELTWTPTDQPVTLWGAPGKSYGGLTFRFGDRSKTIITVPTGRANEDLLMAKLPWADFSGDFAAGRLSGAAVFVHPQHPNFPPEWMTREYGVLAVGWPGVNAQTFPADKTFSCRYRIWLHRGTPPAEEIQKVCDAYSAESRAK
jgi:hypothetical protein